MRARGAWTAALAIALALGACTGGSSAPSREGSRVPSETLLLGTAAGALAVRSPGGSVVLDGGGIATPDGSLVVTASSNAGSTVLTERDAATGEVLGSTRVDGTLDVRVVAADGSAVALMAPLPQGVDPWTPIPRSRTTIVVADPSGVRDPRTYDLAGNLEPEAFSVDGERLFLISFLPARAPSAYRVTVLDLQRARVFPVYGPLKAPTERMPGTRLEQVPAPDGARLYTLYTSARPGYAPHGAEIPRNAISSFVHVLDLSDGWAHCVGLPEPLWHRPASAESMVVSPDGQRLYVVDAGLGIVTVLDTDSLETLRTHRYGVAVPDVERTSAAISPDGATLWIGAGERVLELDAATLTLARTFGASGPVSGLGISADGARLYVAVEGGIELLDASGGSELAIVPIASPSPVLDVRSIAA